MDQTISRSEQKRQSKRIEQLSFELASLSDNDLSRLPCDDAIKDMIRQTRTLKAGALKRQIKFVAKELRQQQTDLLFTFMEERKGSKLKKDNEFKDLERLRNSIITEVLEAHDEARRDEAEEIEFSITSPTMKNAQDLYPSLDLKAVERAALRYARSRKPAYPREIFRLLKGAAERLKFAPAVDENTDNETETES